MSTLSRQYTEILPDGTRRVVKYDPMDSPYFQKQREEWRRKKKAGKHRRRPILFLGYGTI